VRRDAGRVGSGRPLAGAIDAGMSKTWSSGHSPPTFNSICPPWQMRLEIFTHDDARDR
jgi:hypothetical protein